METITEKNYNKFYKENKRAIYHFIYKMTRDEMVSEELVNDVFVKVYQTIDKFDESKSSFKTWIYNIAKHATIDYLRRKKLETQSIQQMAIDHGGDTSEMEFACTQNNPLDELIKNESHEKIQDAIKLLSKNQATIISYAASGFSYDDIAHELNMPLGTVKASMHIARGRMREIFKKPAMA